MKTWVRPGDKTPNPGASQKIENFSLDVLPASRICGDGIKQFSHDTVSKSVPLRSFVDEEDITVGSLDLAHLQKPL